jgi:hypothetical protein
MKYFKNVENGYIVSISTEHGQIEITADEYDNILSVIKSAPQAENGYEYKLRDDLTWEKAKVDDYEIVSVGGNNQETI